MEQDPHTRRIFQAGGRERRDMIRNSARCNTDEVGGPPVMRRGLESDLTSVPAPGRSVGPSSKQPSTLRARLLDAGADQGLLPSAGKPPGRSNPIPSGCVAVQIDPLIQNGPDNGSGA